MGDSMMRNLHKIFVNIISHQPYGSPNSPHGTNIKGQSLIYLLNHKIFLLQFVCVCVCLCECVLVCVCVWLCVCEQNFQPNGCTNLDAVFMFF